MNGNYALDDDFPIGQFAVGIIIFASGDPFVDYTLTATNNGAFPTPVFYSMSIDTQPVVGPGWTMCSSVQYSVEDADGSGMALLNPFGGRLQRGFLSDDGTNFINPPELLLGDEFLSQPGQVLEFDTGTLALPAVPPEFTTDTFGMMGLGGMFIVSPGDTAVITGRFEIVPEPASAVLLMCGLTMLPFWRRRRVE